MAEGGKLYVRSSFAIILMGMRELVALLSLSSWGLVMVVWLFLAAPGVCLRFVIMVFPDHTHLLFLTMSLKKLKGHIALGLSVHSSVRPFAYASVTKK